MFNQEKGQRLQAVVQKIDYYFANYFLKPKLKTNALQFQNWCNFIIAINIIIYILLLIKNIHIKIILKLKRQFFMVFYIMHNTCFIFNLNINCCNFLDFLGRIQHDQKPLNQDLIRKLYASSQGWYKPV